MNITIYLPTIVLATKCDCDDSSCPYYNCWYLLSDVDHYIASAEDPSDIYDDEYN